MQLLKPAFIKHKLCPAYKLCASSLFVSRQRGRITALRAVIVIACASSFVAQAEIYRSTDANGNVTYTDQPAKGAKPVDMRSINSIPAVETQKLDKDTIDSPLAAEKTVTYRSVRIVEPSDDSTIAHGPGDFTVSATSKPKLAKNHALQLYLDGKAYGDAITSGNFTLTNINRGTHKLKVSVVSAAGKRLKNSKSIKVHVFRPSVLQPAY